MCGITISVPLWDHAEIASEESSASYEETFQDSKALLEAVNAVRGPDAQRAHTVELPGPGQRSQYLECYSSELRLRGDAFTVQPHISPKTGNILCWNGEIFEGLDINNHENDGAKLFESLEGLSDPAQIPQLFGVMEGPYAFAYYHCASKRLFFGRDPLGRRSLLMHKPLDNAPYFFLASTSAGDQPGYCFTELDTQRFYELDLGGLLAAIDHVTRFDDYLTKLPRLPEPSVDLLDYPSFASPARLIRSIPLESEEPIVTSLDKIPERMSYAVDGLIKLLDKSVRRRTENIPQNAGALQVESPEARVGVLFSGGIDSAVLALLAHRHIPLDEPIDLLNVAFENPRKLQRQQPVDARRAHKENQSSSDASVQDSSRANDIDYNYMVPDRETGLRQVEELRKLCPNRRWNFVEVDVPFVDAQAARDEVLDIMWPCRTVMDLSLALALYFAARGGGRVRTSASQPSCPYRSPAKVLLNGLGADELLGGYGRHRAAYKNGGWQGLVDELQLDMDRIPIRNLGRDDRIISSHGKEARYPFLSLELVNFIANLPISSKVDPRLELGLGDKMLLRLAARKLGLVEASSRKKRAMQFGTHSARMDAGTLPNDGGELLSK